MAITRSPSSALLSPFGGRVRDPTKIDYRKTGGPLAAFALEPNRRDVTCSVGMVPFVLRFSRETKIRNTTMLGLHGGGVLFFGRYLS